MTSSASRYSLPAIQVELFPDPSGRNVLRGELYGSGFLEYYVQTLAAASVVGGHVPAAPILPRLRENARVLTSAHRRITAVAGLQEPLTPDAEWLLDNFFVIEEVLREVRNDLPAGFYAQLPRLAEGPMRGYPRLAALALGLIVHTDSSLNEPQLLQYLQAYQSVEPLTIGELWAWPTMLRLGLIENLRRLAEQLVQAYDDRAEADRIINGWLAGGTTEPPESPDHLSEAGLVGLLKSLRDRGSAAQPLIAWLERWLAKKHLGRDQLLKNEHRRQAANQVSIGNCVTSLRLLNALDWNSFFEKTSVVEAILRKEPTGQYARQDFVTRDECRRALERLARGSGIAEPEVARRVVARATSADAADPAGHVAYHLIDAGREALARDLGYKPVRLIDRAREAVLARPHRAYFGSLAVGVALGLAVVLAAIDAAPAWWPVVALVALVPVSELVVGLVNYLFTQLLPPRVLPKLDFKDGIPDAAATFVVMPTMLTSPEGARGLIERLELHYLANPDPQLRFALLTDFADAPAEKMPHDDDCLNAALAGVKELNARYAPDGPDRFFVFHRVRLWNPSESCWMGHERKRGKLAEFFRLLRGATDTTFAVQSGRIDSLPRIRYVLTLDSDTQLPRDSARRLISTLAHPLNRARLNAEGTKVVAGYGVLQPRVSFLFQTGRRSRFARVFAHSAGIDPYSSAVSDTYQDLFGTGSFTGKGLIDVDAFERVTAPAFPDNHVLSHDLIEGNFARCGLVTDIEVLDDYPARYHAFSRREHRWARGDWQLLPWLGPTIPEARGDGEAGRRPNVLGSLERWKILDNLRRSLVAPSLAVLLALGWTVLPGSPAFWTVFALVVAALPLILHVTGSLLAVKGGSMRPVWRHVRYNLPFTAAQVAIAAAFILDQARLMAHAIGVTLYRLFVSRRRLLEWETAAAAERRLGTDLATFVRVMLPTSLIALALFGWVATANPSAMPAAGPILFVWLMSPAIAWWLSLPLNLAQRPVSPSDELALRRLARKTWHFFETFVGPEDHWLPPDNFQEDPKGEIAHRTSPTNKGLLLLSTLAAHDFGYLTFGRLVERVGHTLDTLERLEKYRGHILNWYETTTLRVLPPGYVSTVDSGNLLACLLILKNGLHEKLREPLPNPKAANGLADTLALVEEHLPVPLRSGDAVKQLRAALAGVPDDVAGWDDWLTRLAEASRKLRGAVRAGGDLTVWIDRFDAMIADLREELAGIAPAAECLSAEAWLEKWADAKWAEAARSSSLPALVDRARDLARRADELGKAMDFRFLYNPERQLFSIGFNLQTGRLDLGHYDLLASECRIASFLSIARGDVPRKHWFQLGRPVTIAAGGHGLLSWGGTMFEYLMPRLLLPGFADTLLDHAEKTAVARQIEYGDQTGTPWGISESGFYLTDAAQNYQYQSFGVPGLGLKRGLHQDLVIAPYAAMMAVVVDPSEARQNLDRIRQEGGEGPYGVYEAIDYTRARLQPSQRCKVVQQYMAHHQGMGFLAIANRLHGDRMPRRLRVEPMVRAIELLLQERIPLDQPVIYPPAEEDGRPAGDTTGGYPVSRILTTADTPGPRTHALSNGRYTMLVTNSGAGFSTCNGFDVTRRRDDRTRDNTGQFIYVRDIHAGKVWSAAHQPIAGRPNRYEVIYSIDKAEFRRLDGEIETHLEITVSPDEPAEIRRVTLTNLGSSARELEVTSYAEVVLLPHMADLSHPAFGKLFIETEWLPENRAILARRRPRGPGQSPVWAIHTLAVDGGAIGPTSCETDRAKFLGRRRDPSRPMALTAGTCLTHTTGPVLDPVLALRQRVRVEPGAAVTLAFTTGVAHEREAALALADQFNAMHAVTRTFELAWAQSRVELRDLRINVEDAHLYQRLAGHVLFPGPNLRAPAEVLRANTLGQSGLWRFGISGDLPILLVKLPSGDGLELVRQVLSAHAYWRTNGLMIDLVILNEQPGGYLEELQGQVHDIIRETGGQPAFDKPGGIFVRKTGQMTEEEHRLLMAFARVVLHGDRGPLSDQIDVPERLPSLPPKLVPKSRRPDRPAEPLAPRPDMQFWNGVGGFTVDSHEYVITYEPGGPGTPAPWSNVVASADFGFLITEAGGGFTWQGNSQSNRLTPWSNDPVGDPPGEVVYVRDEETGEFWSVTALPVPCPSPARARHGQGYTVFERKYAGIDHELRVSIAPDAPVKLYRLLAVNKSSSRRSLSAVFYAEWVLGTHREQTAPFIITELDEATGAVFARNPCHEEYPGVVAFADVSLRPRSFTGDRAEFLGRNGSPADPAALGRVDLSCRVGAGLDPCVGLLGRFELAAGEAREIVFILGQAADREAARELVRKYHEVWPAEQAYRDTVARYDRFLETLHIRTQYAALDALMNRWLLYQVLSCRFWGRSAFYQSGGAIGYRDQLQDAMALVYGAPALTRAMIVTAAGRQFPEGDVQHWWHPPSGRGVRTRCSDDYLWLPFVTAHYLRLTGDATVLDEPAGFISMPPLREGQEDSYGQPEKLDRTASVYEHCLLALDRAAGRGPHGLALIGSGDWNDGMNHVGLHGRGESVWLSWFLLMNYRQFAGVCEQRGDPARAAEYRKLADRLRSAIDDHGWDGDWYRRAYFDDGTPLGSATNDECQIDSLPQSWAVICGAGDAGRARQGLMAAVNRLVDREWRIIKLFDPPFDKTAMDPGYIKGYLPGIRENGGQYTHAAAWVVLAAAGLGDGRLAMELIDLMNPVRHGDSPEHVARYRIEPYVMAGDVYGGTAHPGRGGWSWYTGSASWYYRVILEAILGFQKTVNELRIEPCIPNDWKSYEIRYRHGTATYKIMVENPSAVERGVAEVWSDGAKLAGGTVKLVDDGKEHIVRVVMG